MQQLQDEATRQAALDRMKRRATALLVAATVIFIVARFFETRLPWIGILRATAEAHRRRCGRRQRTHSRSGG
jgi:hypothetical protein